MARKKFVPQVIRCYPCPCCGKPYYIVSLPGSLWLMDNNTGFVASFKTRAEAEAALRAHRDAEKQEASQ